MKKSQWLHKLTIYGPAVLLIILVFSYTLHFIKPAPPKTIKIATGELSGAYHAYAEEYKRVLKKQGITLELQSTNGSVENLTLLQSGAADVAFIQGGSVESDLPGLYSLASLYYEPLWLFHQKTQVFDRLGKLKNKRISIGSEGSGTRALAQQLLAKNELDETNTDIQSLGNKEAIQALKNKQLDAAFFVSSANSPVIDELLHTDNLELAVFSRAAAYTRHFHYLSVLDLPEGALDLKNNIPPRNTPLLAVTANLVSGEGLHPSLIGLLIQTAEEVHGSTGRFEKAGEFPSNEHLIFTQPKASKRYFKHGAPFLQRYMPFWAASLLDRIKIMILPFFLLLLPMLKFMPHIYRWRMHARIYRWYDKLEAIDIAVGKEPAAKLLAKLDHIEDDVQKVRVPLSFADRLYHLREHIDLVRGRIEQGGAKQTQLQTE